MAVLVVTIALAGLAAAGAGYCLFAAAALRRLLANARRAYERRGRPTLPVSLLVPVAGADPAFPASARDFLAQRYEGGHEVVFCVLDPDDRGAIDAARAAIAEAGLPPERARVSVGDGRSAGPNRKVSNLAQGIACARHDVIAMADADMRPAPDFLERLVAPLVDPAVALSTSLYRGHEPRGIGGAFEALAIDADFIPSVAVAQALEPVRFALGAAIALRRAALAAVGGIEPLGRYIGEDYHLGRLVAERVGPVEFAPAVLPTHVGRMSVAAHIRHQVRWARTVRAQRPAGYLGLVATNPLVPALAALALARTPWAAALVAAVIAVRAAASIAGAATLGSSGALGRAALLPAHDLVRFGIWLAGALGGDVVWRGRRYRIARDGVIVPSEADPERLEAGAQAAAPQRRELRVVRAVGRVAGVEVDLGEARLEPLEEPLDEALGHAERPQDAVAPRGMGDPGLPGAAHGAA
jgi:ceramide glucosyltransferase